MANLKIYRQLGLIFRIRGNITKLLCSTPFILKYKVKITALLYSKKLLKVVENNQYVWNIFVFPNVTSIYEEDKWDGDWMRKK